MSTFKKTPEARVYVHLKEIADKAYEAMQIVGGDHARLVHEDLEMIVADYAFRNEGAIWEDDE